MSDPRTKRRVTPKNAKLIPPEAKRVFAGVIYDVYQWPVTMYDGSEGIFEMLQRADTVQVIAIVEGKLLITEQKQPDSPKTFYDVPSGRHDEPGEDEFDAAIRETKEETGYTFKQWRLVSAYQTLPKIEQMIYTFLAYDVEDKVEQQLDAGEQIIDRLMSLDEVKELDKRGEMRYLPQQIKEATSIDDLLNLPEYQ